MKALTKELSSLLQKAYSAEKAAALAYQGHAASVRNREEKKAIMQIEADEWHHRHQVKQLMDQYSIPVSRSLELRYFLIGKAVALSCHVIGWFMPYFFAGKLESGNVCEYFRMMRLFYHLHIDAHNQMLYEMGIKEKEHELFFLNQIRNKKRLQYFERLFGWGIRSSINDVDLGKKYPVDKARLYCGKKV